MRISEWRIVWDPLGSSPRVLLDYGDLMLDELARSIDSAIDVGRFDFALKSRPVSRGNRRLEHSFSRVFGHDFIATSWLACIDEMLSIPWAEKTVMRISVLGGGSRYFIATQATSSHEPTVGLDRPESVHEWSFRAGSYSFTPTGPGISIIGGWYNPPGQGIVIIIPGSGTVNPGDTIHVIGVPGVPDGYYTAGPVTNVGGNANVSIPDAEHDQPGRKDAGLLIGGSRSGWVVAEYPGSRIVFRGIGDGAVYDYRVGAGGSWTSVGSVIGGYKSINIGTLASRRDYVSWWGASDVTPGPPIAGLDPLVLDGQSRPNGTPGTNCTQTKLDDWTVQLRRNGTVIDTQSIDPDWTAAKAFNSGVPSHTVNMGIGPTFTLRGPGGGPVAPSAVGSQINGGTVTPVVGGAG